jgi:hypothetical protein
MPLFEDLKLKKEEKRREEKRREGREASYIYTVGIR